MKLRSKESYWLLKNGLLHSYPSLQHDIKCEVLVVGGGITGALMAYQFSVDGYKTVLIDKRDVATGSTCATTALLQYEIDEPLHTLINKVGKEAAIDSYRGGVAAIRKLARIIKKVDARCGFEQKQSVYFASSKSDTPLLTLEYECRKTAGLDVTWLNKQELQTRFNVEGEGAILSRSAASVDAYTLTHDLLQYSVKYNSLRIYDHTEAEHVSYSPGYNEVITDTGRTIRCSHIIYATGYESQKMAGKKTVSLFSTYAFITEPISNLPRSLTKTIFWNTQQPYLYFRTTPDNRLLVGGADEKFKDDSLRDMLIEKKESRLVKAVEKIIPSLKLIPDFSWAGTFGSTKDSLPYIGPHPDYPNSHFVLGFGGNGITFSVMGMDILKDSVAGRPNKFLGYYRFGR